MKPVYTIANGHLKSGEALFAWLRHYNLTPSWGEWDKGEIQILLPESQISCLRMMQCANPARFGNAPTE